MVEVTDEVVDKVARRLHYLYYERFLAQVHYVTETVDFDQMDDHADALKGAVRKMLESGEIVVGVSR